MKGSVELALDEMSDQIRAAISEFGDRIIDGAAVPGAAVTREDKTSLKQLCRKLRDQRKARTSHFPANLFHEPAWEILIALYIAHVEMSVMYVKSLVLDADAPVATSQRWIEHLANLGLVMRREDATDRRRIEVSLSDTGVSSMENYLLELSANA